MRLLIVEDEKQICDAVAKSLYDAGYGRALGGVGSGAELVEKHQ